MCIFDDLANWLVAIGTLALAFTAVFQDWLRSLLYKPDLFCDIKLEPPDCHKTVITAQIGNKVFSSNIYYFRFKIWNKGNVAAKQVEAIITKLYKKIENSYLEIQSFSPDNLLWSTTSEIYRDISADTYRHCNLGHIISPNNKDLFNESKPGPNIGVWTTVFSFDVEFKSAIRYYIIEPGEYKVEIKIGSDNAKTITERYEIKISGDWSEDENVMFSKGFSIKKTV